MLAKYATGTWDLFRFMFRLDRLKILLWLIGFTFFTLIVPLAFLGLYDSDQDRFAMAQTMENPAMIAMVGPGELDNYTLGAMTTHQMLLMTAVVAGLMSILLLARHTRGDEEDGRIELIRSLPTGRLSYLNAGILMLTATSILISVIIGAGLSVLSIESMDLNGSMLYGASLGGTALVFAGITAVFAQLTSTSRGTIGLSVGVLVAMYLIRAVTDISEPAWSWAVPLAWSTKTEAYSSNNWWPVLLMIGFSLLLFILANYLQSIRDMDRGFLPDRAGRRHASPLLKSPLGAAWRLQRMTVLYWAIGMFVIGAAYGSVMGDMEAFFAGNEMFEQMLAGSDGLSLTDQFIPMLVIVMSILAAVPPVMAMNKLRSEEKKDRIEYILAHAVSQYRLFGGYLFLAVVNAALMVFMAMFGFWIAADAVMDDGMSLTMMLEAGFSYFPAILFFVGINALLTGFFPKWTSFVWLYLLYTFFVLYLGQLMDFPEWTGKLSPFGYVSQVPVEDAALTPLLITLILAAVLMAIGAVAFRRRDIRT